ncbi:MAG: GIY-YIG nuclease family protein, partial [Candidatus Aureabacteria bacterium]|nr:GIY-YIG nuclease family protein [Candidatus Auribacterota bacterium]
MKKRWHLYIIECRDGTLYTGITNDLARRIGEHNRGKGCRYTRFRGPVRLLYAESCAGRSGAMKREARIKALPRAKKLRLAAG